MLQWLRRQCAKRKRAYDVANLFPLVREHTPNTESSFATIMVHMQNDPAWSNYFSYPELVVLAREHAHDTI